jgi:dienelactone hydrolase
MTSAGKGRIVVLVVAAAALWSASSGTTGGPLFDYDASLPLDAVFGVAATSSGIVRQSLSFEATGSLRLKAILVHPSSGGPWPLVIWSPGAGGDRLQQLPDALAAARAGLASLLIDAPAFSNCRDGQADLDAFTAYVVSRRRAVDLAQTLENVDAGRMAAVGFSLGAEVTASLAGVEHRIGLFALASGRGHNTGFARAICTSFGPALGTYLRTLAPVDPVHWVGAATRASFLVQNGTRDALTTRGDVLALYRAIGRPKELRWYPAGHDLNPAASADRLRWLVSHLRHQ